MAASKPKRQEYELEPRAGPAVPRERASADYENPRQDVSDIPDPVILSTNKARGGIPVRNMRVVLGLGIALAILAFIVGYLLA